MMLPFPATAYINKRKQNTTTHRLPGAAASTLHFVLFSFALLLALPQQTQGSNAMSVGAVQMRTVSFSRELYVLCARRTQQGQTAPWRLCLGAAPSAESSPRSLAAVVSRFPDRRLQHAVSYVE